MGGAVANDGALLIGLNDLLLTATAGGGCDLIVPALGTGVRIPLGSFSVEKEMVVTDAFFLCPFYQTLTYWEL